MELSTVDLNQPRVRGGSNLKTRRKRLSIVFAEVFRHKARSRQSRVKAERRDDRLRLCDWCGPSPPRNPESITFRIFSFVSAGHNII